MLRLIRNFKETKNFTVLKCVILGSDIAFEIICSKINWHHTGFIIEYYISKATIKQRKVFGNSSRAAFLFKIK